MAGSRVLATWAALCWFAGCGPVLENEQDFTQSSDAIVGGTVNRNDPNVFLLVSETSRGSSICTATLIGTRTLLTAAHCVDDTAATLYVTNAPNDSEINPRTNLWNVTARRIHPQWVSTSMSLFGDIAAVQIGGTLPNVTPKAVNFTNISSLVGRTARLVGYGTTGSTGAGSGVKRQVSLPIRQLSQYNLFVGNMTNMGICHGDSGGPTFYTFADGVERVIGVHSFTIGETCVDGADSRTDYADYAARIQGWLAEWETPQCTDDGRCKAGCNPPDIDCLCATDGVCSAQCPTLSRDADCPANCGADQICAARPATGPYCPVVDPDCTNVGALCSRPDQCSSRLCVIDDQNSIPYCSQACTSDAQCPTLMQCDRTNNRNYCVFKPLPRKNLGEACVPGGTYCGAGNGKLNVCAGPLAGTEVCALPCSTAAECPPENSCELSADMMTKYCQTIIKPAVVLQRAVVSDVQAAQGCSSAGSSLVLVLSALLLRRRRSA